MKKDTIYIDIDDEITAIIDKLQSSKAKIVALVLPKRATALQSIVNMKLLKRAAEQAEKQAVLITAESSLLPLAGATGMYVAKNLQSKPEIPLAPDSPFNSDEEVVANVDEEEIDPNKSVGELSGAATAGSAKKDKPKAANAKKPGGKKPKIPNFEKFRTKLFIGAGVFLVLLIGWYVAAFVMPRATIAIDSDTENVVSSFQFTANPELSQPIDGENTIPATLAEVDKNDTQTVTATGERDESARATGTVTFSISCGDVDNFPVTIPSGTGVSAQGKTYITQSTAVLSSPGGGGGCSFTGSSPVRAQNTGDQFNIGPANYSINGYSDVTGSGTAMTGGSSKVVTVVSENDVETAKRRIAVDDESVGTELVSKLQEQQQFAIKETLNTVDEKTDISPRVGQEADEVTVNYSAKFTMLGVSQENLEALIRENIADQVDLDRQGVQDYGLDNAAFTVAQTNPGGSVVISIDTDVVVGPDIDVDQLKTELSRQKRGEAESTIRALPGVRNVRVELSPFWVMRVPSNPNKTTINFEAVE